MMKRRSVISEVSTLGAWLSHKIDQWHDGVSFHGDRRLWTPCPRLNYAGIRSTAANDLSLKKRCAVLMTSYITLCHQYSATSFYFFKIKFGMGRVSKLNAVQFIYCTAPNTLNCRPLNFTALHPTTLNATSLPVLLHNAPRNTELHSTSMWCTSLQSSAL